MDRVNDRPDTPWLPQWGWAEEDLSTPIGTHYQLHPTREDAAWMIERCLLEGLVHREGCPRGYARLISKDPARASVAARLPEPIVGLTRAVAIALDEVYAATTEDELMAAVSEASANASLLWPGVPELARAASALRKMSENLVGWHDDVTPEKPCVCIECQAGARRRAERDARTTP